jgi:hypothetical protein
MLTADDLAQVRSVFREELTRVLHPSVQRPAPAPLPAANDLEHPEPPPPDAA